MTPIIVIACIVGLVWGTLFAMRGSLLSGCLTFLILACCFGPHFASFDVVGITLSIDRFFLVGLAATYVIQWRLGRTEPKPLTWVDLSIASMISIFAISAVMHESQSTVADEAAILPHLINGYFIPLVVYWIARQAPLNERRLTGVLAVLTCFGGYLALTGLLEATGQWSLVFPRYIADPEVGLHFGRARGPMVQSVSYGVYLGACLLCAWLLREKLARHWRVLIVLAIPAFLSAVYFSKTRSVWIGVGSGIFVVLALTLKGRVRVGMLGAMIVACLFVTVIKMDSIAGLNREGTVQDTHKSNSMRGSFAYVSWLIFQDHPLFGLGFGQFTNGKLPYLSDRSTELHLEATREYVHHSTFLGILTETGLIGLSLFVAILIGWVRAALRLVRSERAPPWVRRHGVLTLGVLSLAFWQMVAHEITFTPLDMSLLFFIAGICVGLQTFAARQARNESSPILGASSPRQQRLSLPNSHR